MDDDVEVSSHSRGFFCSEIGQLGCDLSHSYKAKCDFMDSVTSQLAFSQQVGCSFRYDILAFTRPFSFFNMFSSLTGETFFERYIIFPEQTYDGIDHCPMYIREAIACSENSDPFGLNDEFYGESSKCFYTDRGEPMCLRSTCNELNQTIDVYYKDAAFSCTHDGQIIDTKKGLRIECPRIAAVCPR